MLSDSTRRKEYDLLYAARKDRANEPGASGNFFSAFSGMFSGGARNAGATPAADRPDADNVFADVFEEVWSIQIVSYYSVVIDKCVVNVDVTP